MNERTNEEVSGFLAESPTSVPFSEYLYLIRVGGGQFAILHIQKFLFYLYRSSFLRPREIKEATKG
jgi:hypothetical protein